MDIQQRISQQRVRHIIDSYRLMGTADEADSFEAYVSELLSQYPHGLIELALVETLAKNWLTIPMQKGVTFLAAAHERIKQLQSERQSKTLTVDLTPSQFSQITGLDPELAFAALVESPDQPTALPTQVALD
jgi:murein L,D-transpeptidase YcbB/YkuD